MKEECREECNDMKSMAGQQQEQAVTCPCCLAFQLMLIIGLAQALVVFRVVAAPWLSELNWEFISDNAGTVAVILGAVLHYVTIQIMTRVRLPYL